MNEWNIRELPAVPQTVPIARLLETLQEKRTEICVVIDEHGGTAGIVTMSDVMEQIVGRIDDEYVHDLVDEAKTLDDGSYLIDGALPIGEPRGDPGLHARGGRRGGDGGRFAARVVRPHPG